MIVNIGNLIFVSVAVLLFGLILKWRESRPQKGNPVKSLDQEGPELEDLNEKFLRAVGDENVVSFVRIFSDADQMIIRSLLDSMGILSYLKPNSLNSIYPGLTVNGHTDTIITIMEKDIPEAKTAVLESIEVLKQENPDKIKEFARNAAEITFLRVPLANGGNRIFPELLV